MEEEGIVDCDCLPPDPRCPLPRNHCLGSGQRRGVGASNSLDGQSRDGEVTWPLMTTYGAKFESGPSELSFFKGGAGYLVLVLHLTAFLATGEP